MCAGLPALDALVDELIKRPPKSTTRDYVESIGAAVLIALALRAFVIEAFKIPSSSMYPTLEINDHIFVNKFIYGVRIPWTSTKLFELRGPRRGEVIVFMQPCQPDKDYIKRVIATAGETVEVRCNVVYVNGEAIPSKLLAEPDGRRCEYMDRDDLRPESFPRSCSRYQETVDGLAYNTFHDPERPQRDERRRSEEVGGDSKDFPELGGSDKNCSTLTDKNEGGPAPNQLAGTLVERKLPGVVPGEACQQQYHYGVPPGHVFVMGDNRFNSNDSRFWGSVPVENIKGKALFIWLSYVDWTDIRWDRIGNFVH